MIRYLVVLILADMAALILVGTVIPLHMGGLAMADRLVVTSPPGSRPDAGGPAAKSQALRRPTKSRPASEGKFDPFKD